MWNEAEVGRRLVGCSLVMAAYGKSAGRSSERHPSSALRWVVQQGKTCGAFSACAAASARCSPFPDSLPFDPARRHLQLECELGMMHMASVQAIGTHNGAEGGAAPFLSRELIALPRHDPFVRLPLVLLAIELAVDNAVAMTAHHHQIFRKFAPSTPGVGHVVHVELIRGRADLALSASPPNHGRPDIVPHGRPEIGVVGTVTPLGELPVFREVLFRNANRRRVLPAQSGASGSAHFGAGDRFRAPLLPACALASATAIWRLLGVR